MTDDLHEQRAVIRKWLSEPASAEVNRAIERIAGSDDVQRVAIMPDAHLSHDVCVGTVVATSRLVYPNAVGGDIGCGLATIALNAQADLFASSERATQTFAELHQCVPTNRHRRETVYAVLPESLTPSLLSAEPLQRVAKRDGVVQLGTLGRGNHFVEFQADEDERLWLMVHSGSRAMGQSIRDWHLARAVKTRSGLAALDAGSVDGMAYVSDVAWARAYASENRLAMLRSVVAMMRRTCDVEADASTLCNVDHNHVRRERHFDQDWWVHRKGASDAHQDMPGLIPGSMGSATFHTIGRGETEALCSSSHGAGRALSRDAARRSVTSRDFLRDMRGVWFDQRMLRALREEAPSAYRDVRAVMRAQRELTKISQTLRPVLCYKGG